MDPKAAMHWRSLLLPLGLKLWQHEAAVAGIVFSKRAVSFVVQWRTKITKQHARQRFAQLYNAAQVTWATAEGDVEALDALHVKRFGWQMPPAPTPQQVVQAALAAARKDGIDGLRMKIPVLSGVDDDDLVDWIKGGLLERILLHHLDLAPALTDCKHELARCRQEENGENGNKCWQCAQPRVLCGSCSKALPKCPCGREAVPENQAPLPCAECVDRWPRCGLCNEPRPLCWHCKACGGRWCHPCAMKEKAKMLDAEAVHEAVAQIKAAEERGGEQEEEPEDLAKLLEGAEEDWRSFDDIDEIVRIHGLSKRKRRRISGPEEQRELLALRDGADEDLASSASGQADPTTTGPALELAIDRRVAADGRKTETAVAQLTAEARTWAAAADAPRGAQHDCEGYSWAWFGHAGDSMEPLECVHKGRMSDRRRIDFVLHVAALDEEDGGLEPVLNSLPKFYRHFHALFRNDYRDSAGCHTKARKLFQDFVQRADPAFRLPSTSQLPLPVRVAVEGITQGEPVYRCLKCMEKMKDDKDFCSEACQGRCRCMFCPLCKIEESCEVCDRNAGRGKKRPRPVCTEQFAPEGLFDSPCAHTYWTCNADGRVMRWKNHPPVYAGMECGRRVYVSMENGESKVHIPELEFEFPGIRFVPSLWHHNIEARVAKR